VRRRRTDCRIGVARGAERKLRTPPNSQNCRGIRADHCAILSHELIELSWQALNEASGRSAATDLRLRAAKPDGKRSRVACRPSHWTLRLPANIALLLGWAAVVSVAVHLSATVPVGFLAAGTIFGVFGGLLQWLAISRARNEFAQATTAFEVRRVLRRTLPGKIYLVVFWGFSMVAVLAPLVSIGLAPLGARAILGPLAAWGTFKLVRETITLFPVARFAEARPGGPKPPTRE
jgi:hypothetical protein